MFKTTKAKIIFVLVFSIICLTVTGVLILYKNIEIEGSIKETVEVNVKKENVKEYVEGIDLKGTYNQNDLQIEEKSITQDKIEIRYFQINGLKDKSIQKKINEEIKSAALNCYKEEIKDMGEIININVSMSETANFANTISFELGYAAKIDDNDDGFYQGVQGINYDLNTGEEIAIDKIFTDNAPIQDIMRKASYYNLIELRTEDNLAGDLVISDYGDIESEMLKIMTLFKRGEIREFYYTPTNINIIYDKNQTININMNEFSQYIAIYNRYLSEESLYENNDIGIKNMYTLTRRYNNIYYYNNYQNEDNYFIDISIDFQSTQDDEFAKQIVQDKIIQIENEIEKIKKNVLQNPNNFYILNYFISVYTGEEKSTDQILTRCNEKGNSYEMTVSDFKQNIEPIIINQNRQDYNGGLPGYIYDFSNILELEPQTIMEYYIPETGEKIVI